MFKFNTWPPEPGQVELTEGFTKVFETSDSRALGNALGELLVANMPKDKLSDASVIVSQWVYSRYSPESLAEYGAPDGFDDPGPHPLEQSANLAIEAVQREEVRV